MFERSDDKTQLLQNLSALADGELDAAAAALACAQWRSDAEVRSAWHAYRLIGDTMRSEELASDTARDALFLHSLARRLAEEPVVLAPQPAAERAPARPRDRDDRRRSRGSWMMPAAVAAGFMAVASVLVVTRGTASVAWAEDLLARAFTGPGTVVVATPGPDLQAEPQTLVADGQLIRDARLERYFAAHTQFGGSSALGVPSGFLRAATTQTPER